MSIPIIGTQQLLLVLPITVPPGTQPERVARDILASISLPIRFADIIGQPEIRQVPITSPDGRK